MVVTTFLLCRKNETRSCKELAGHRINMYAIIFPFHVNKFDLRIEKTYLVWLTERRRNKITRATATAARSGTKIEEDDHAAVAICATRTLLINMPGGCKRKRTKGMAASSRKKRRQQRSNRKKFASSATIRAIVAQRRNRCCSPWHTAEGTPSAQ